MVKNKTLIGRIVGIGLVSISTASLAIAALAWFAKPSAQTEDHIDGIIGLRGYFYAGTGEKNDPFEIVWPQHLYNLSRLQSLGIFADKTYFRVGHLLNDNGTPDNPDDDVLCLYDRSTGAQIDPIKNGVANPDFVVDMSDFCSGDNPRRLRPIGSEETPFNGAFEGNGIPIKGLIVEGNPEDIGVFGYVSCEGSVRGLVCDGLDIYSLGYSKATGDNPQLGDEKLYGHSIDDLFNSSDYLATETSLRMYDISGETDLKATTSRNINETGGISLSNIDTSLYSDGYHSGVSFKAFFPDDSHNEGFTYSVKSSTPLLKTTTKVDGVETGIERIVIDLNKFPVDSKAGAQIDTRLSLVASVAVGDYTYSRVIQSYTFKFKLSNSKVYKIKSDTTTTGAFKSSDWNEQTHTEYAADTAYAVGDIVLHKKEFYVCKNPIAANVTMVPGETTGWSDYWEAISAYNYQNTYNNSGETLSSKYVYRGSIGVTILCDYVRENDEYATNYHHGTNIGFLAGHVDGSFTQSFVHDARFHINSDVNNNKINSESDTGLIGEIGNNVANTLDPEYTLSSVGDTGVVNFSDIYDGIRNDASVGNRIKAGVHGNNKYASYTPKSGDFFDLYDPYLRKYKPNASSTYYITGTKSGFGVSGSQWKDYTISVKDVDDEFNSIDFVPNKIIKDDLTNSEDRGLGVFKIATSYYDGTPVYDTNIGQCRIVNGDPKDMVYFSTAEYAHKVYKEVNGVKQWVNYGTQPAWGTGAGQIMPLRSLTTPSHSDSETFEYPFSRDYNYCFALDLTDMESSNGMNYMWNTKSDFLRNYLSTVLIDKTGRPVSSNTLQFGFMFAKESNGELSFYNEFSSYMPLKKPDKAVAFQENEETKYYPSNSVVFEIENDNGANVSVVGNGADISIYSYDPDNSTTAPSALMTMKSANSANYATWAAGTADEKSVDGKDYDFHRFFTYDIISGATSSVARAPMNYSPHRTYEVGDIVYHANDGEEYWGDSHHTCWYLCTTAVTVPEAESNSFVFGDHFEEILEHDILSQHYWYDTVDHTIPAGTYAIRNGRVIQTVAPFTLTGLHSSGYGLPKISDGTNASKWQKVDTYMHDENALYAHIFKLPKGHYVIGAANANTTANLYYLAVQGQKKGNINTDELPSGYIDNVVKDVDFLYTSPSFLDYRNHDFKNEDNNTGEGNYLRVAKFSFEANFNSHNPGVFTVGNTAIGGTNYMKLSFNNSQAFVSYLFIHCRSTNNGHSYYINSDPPSSPYTGTDFIYPNL